MPLGTPNPAVVSFVDKIVDVFINPIIFFLVALAVLYFLWGLFLFIKDQGNETAREEGKSHMIWGIAGVFIMFAVYGILDIITTTANEVGR
jgi:succinate dehydrogenase/fumarate reductase cytochrome b subunit